MKAYKGFVTKKPLRCFNCMTIPVVMKPRILCLVCKATVEARIEKLTVQFWRTTEYEFKSPEELISDWNAMQLKRLGL